MNSLHFFVGLLGNASALILFLTPIMVFKRIVQNKSTQEFSGVPYIWTFLNCLLFAWYGLPFVSPHNILVTTVNATGVLIETMYILTFIIYAPKKEKLNIIGLWLLVAAVFSGVAFVSLSSFHGGRRTVFCGLAAAIFSIFMYGSPISIIRIVITTKSVEYMPFVASLFVFLCGTFWFIFGLLGKDPFIAVPNGVGAALGAIQLLLYFVYRDSEAHHCESPTTQDESVEVDTRKSHQLHANSV